MLVCLGTLTGRSAQRDAATGRAARLPYDPMCSLTNSGALVALRPVPPGTQRMIQRLAQFRESIDPTSVPFLNDRMIPILRSNLAVAVGLGIAGSPIPARKATGPGGSSRGRTRRRSWKR
jgi:hypothetical protein